MSAGALGVPAPYWRAELSEPGGKPVSYEAHSYEAALAWLRGVLQVREARPRAVLTLTSREGATRRYAVRGGGFARMTVHPLEG